jgi:hypothetical protein
VYHWGRNIQTSPRAHKCLVPALTVYVYRLVSIVTGYGLDDRGSTSGRTGFLSSPPPDRGSTQIPVQWVPGFLPRGKTTGVKT